MTRSELRIRRATPDDVPTIAVLLSQLGYDLDATEVRRRFQAISRSPDHALFVGELHGCAIALLHVFERPAMEKPPEAVVQALAVAATCRRLGVGQALMQFAETWARQRGLDAVFLASRVDRDDAHGFYHSIGYQHITTSHVFRKRITT